jgi:methylated-DNA-[protein]-cysteine S-methyltransferase
MVERSGNKVKRIFFSNYMPDEQSDLAEQIVQYVEGRGPVPQVELDLSGCTEFQRRVFEVLQGVPRGETTTYGELAAMAGNPGAARAVGRVLASNPFAVIVPCHRVVAKQGLGGYFWGIEIKKKLLSLEQLQFNQGWFNQKKLEQGQFEQGASTRN